MQRLHTAVFTYKYACRMMTHRTFLRYLNCSHRILYSYAFRNNLVGFYHGKCTLFSHSKPFYFSQIAKRSSRNRRALYLHRLKNSHRRYCRNRTRPFNITKSRIYSLILPLKSKAGSRSMMPCDASACSVGSVIIAYDKSVHRHIHPATLDIPCPAFYSLIKACRICCLPFDNIEFHITKIAHSVTP